MFRRLPYSFMLAAAVLIPFALGAQQGIEKKKQRFIRLLNELPSRSTQKVITGEFCQWGDYSYYHEIETIHQKSGVWLGMLGLDYHNLDMTTKTPPPLTKQTAVANERVIAYGTPVCNMSMHLNNPFTGESAWSHVHHAKTIFDEHSSARKNLERQLDSIAGGIAVLQQHGILVMLRPYHEMNGDWFWWGQWSPEDFHRLWKLTYSYFTGKKGLKNIVWCYSPFCWPHVYTSYYPGDDYVDAVCVDLYDSNMIQGLRAPYDSLSKLHKPFGLGEYGCMGSSDWFWETRYVHNFSSLAKDLQKFPRVCFLLMWNLHWGFSRHEGLSVLQDPIFMNRPQLQKYFMMRSP